MSIEREQPSTAFKTMPHIVTFDGLFATQACFHEPDNFLKLGDIKGAFQADDLTGAFEALNETTNVRPAKGESISIVHPDFKTGYNNGTSQEGLFKPQDIDTKGSLIVGDKHFTPDRGGDSLTGDGRPMKIWTTGGASTFEDRHVGDYDANDAVFSMREKVGSTAGPGGSTFMTETFEPAAGMDSFGESLNPVLELGGTAGPGGTSFMTGQFEMPTNKIGGSAGPGGDDI